MRSNHKRDISLFRAGPALNLFQVGVSKLENTASLEHSEDLLIRSTQLIAQLMAASPEVQALGLSHHMEWELNIWAGFLSLRHRNHPPSSNSKLRPKVILGSCQTDERLLCYGELRSG